MVKLTVCVLYSTAAVSVRYDDIRCLCSVLHSYCECTIWALALYVLYSIVAVSVRYGDTHCLCSVFHCGCECTI